MRRYLNFTAFTMIWWAGIFFMPACSSESGGNIADIQTIDVNGYFLTVDFPSDSLGRTSNSLIVMDHYMIMEDATSDRIMLMYNFIDKRLTRFMKRGRGPDEGLGLLSLDVIDARERIFRAYDLNGKFFTFRIDSIGTPLLIDTEDACQDGEYWRKAADSIVIVCPMKTAGNGFRYEIRNCGGKVLSYFGPRDDRSLTADICNDIFSETETLSPDGKTLGLFSISGVYYKIYNISDPAKPTLVKYNMFVPPAFDKFERENGSIEFSNTFDNTMGFSGLISDGQCFYAAYSGQVVADLLRAGTTNVTCTKILAVTYDGDKELFLDFGGTEIDQLAYDSCNDMIYVLCIDDDGKYSLKSCEASVLNDIIIQTS